MEDADLVAAARRGDAAAFEDLVRRTGRALYARVLLDANDPHLAEDLVQETYLKAWRDLKQLQDDHTFRPWLYAVARTVTLDAARRRARKKRDAGREVAGPGHDALAAPAPTPAEDASRAEERRRVLALVRNLPEEYRQVVALRYLVGEDYDAIGRQLGITGGSLRGLLNRGMTMLRAEYLKLEKQRRRP